MANFNTMPATSAGVLVEFESPSKIRDPFVDFVLDRWGHLYAPPTPVQKLLLVRAAINWSLPIKWLWLGCLRTQWATHQASCLVSAHRNWDQLWKLLLFGVAKKTGHHPLNGGGEKYEIPPGFRAFSLGAPLWAPTPILKTTPFWSSEKIGWW